MVLIPAMTLSAPSIGPTHHKPGHANGPGKGKGKGKGKDQDKDHAECTGGDRRHDRGPDGERPGDRDCGTPPPAGAGEGATVVGAFWIDAREVSVRDYGDCVSAGKCGAAGAAAGCTASSALGEHPITCVTRDQASAFCAWREKRLVSDVEWTAAAAGDADRRYPWGAEVPSPERLNACGAECATSGMYAGRDPFRTSAPGGSFPLGGTPEGVFDLAGNVAEWVDAPGGLVRGGSYADVDASEVEAMAARSIPADAAGPTVGLRCARDP